MLRQKASIARASYRRTLETWGDKQAAIRFGAELPTGKNDAPGDASSGLPEFVRQQLSPINGGFAFHSDLSYSQAHGRFIYGGNVEATLRGERDGYRLGHEVRINTDLEYVLLPHFEMKAINGRTVRLGDYKGKVILLNFWATWCAPCRAEMPDLIKLQKEYQAKGLQVVGVTYPDYTRAGVRAIAKRLRLNYPILLGTRELADQYGVGEVLPTTLVIDREGKIRARILGILEPDEFEQSVKPLLQ
jgi:thiol-disulfide isomerase/thioredoxin